MSEESPFDSLGVDQSAVEALARADVRTPQELSDADPEAVAMASGIPVERIRDWQRRARKAGAKKAMSPAAKGWLVGIVCVAIALLLGWALMSIGSDRVREAAQIKATAESKLEIAVSFVAADAVEEIRKARLALHNNNWGSAATTLSRVEDKITVIGQVAPSGRKSEIDGLRNQLMELQQSVSDQSNNTAEQLDALEAALDALRAPE
jgi:hypothetical protein